MTLDDIITEMDEPDARCLLPSGVDPWSRVALSLIDTGPNPNKVAGGHQARETTRFRHGMATIICENPDCKKEFQVDRFRMRIVHACSAKCRDKAGRLRRAGKIAQRPHAVNVTGPWWELGHAAKKAKREMEDK